MAKEEKKAEKEVKKAKPEAKKPAAKKPTVKVEKKNDDFVVVNVNKSQEKVKMGDTFSVNKIAGETGSKLKFDEVLLTFKDGKTTIGKPNVDKSMVEVEIVEQYRGKKIHSNTYKAKARYRRRVGHRSDLTLLKVTNIKY